MGSFKKYVFPGAAAIMSAAALAFLSDSGRAGILVWVCAVPLYYLYAYLLRRGAYIHEIVTAGVGAGILTLIAVTQEYDSFGQKTAGFPMSLVQEAAAVGGVFCLLFFALLAMFITGKSKNTQSGRLPRPWVLFLISFAVILLCWLPAALLEYPGVITYDSVQQLDQVYGTAALSNHHPLASTALIWLFCRFGSLFTDSRTGQIAFYSAFQMAALDASFCYLIAVLRRHGAGRGMITGTILFFALMPIHAKYAVSMWKDILFAAFALTFCVSLFELLTGSGRMRQKRRAGTYILFGIACAGFCLLRTNGLLAFIPVTAVLLIIGRFFAKYRVPARVCTAALLTCACIVYIIYPACGVRQPDCLEALSIPIQQISCVIADGGDLTEEQLSELGRVVDISAVKDKFMPEVDDFIKQLIRQKDGEEYISAHKAEFLKLWVKIGLQNPRLYIEEYFCQVGGFFYPSSRWIVMDLTYHNDLGLKASPVYLFAMQGLFTASWQDFFLDGQMSALWTIGGQFWVFAAAFLYCAARRRRDLYVYYLPFFTLYATLLLATPASGEFRYMYSLFVTMPLLLCLPFLHEGPAPAEGKEGKKQDLNKNCA